MWEWLGSMSFILIHYIAFLLMVNEVLLRVYIIEVHILVNAVCWPTTFVCDYDNLAFSYLGIL
jgi:hypothetical protein